MKKGFTIVELIAVIILVGLLALITIPRIAGLIDDSTMSTEESAAKNYIETIDKSILENSLEHPKTSEYELSQADLASWAEENVMGDVPESGRILVKDNHVQTAILQMETYKVFCSKTDCQAIEDFGDYVYYIGEEINIKDALKATLKRPVDGEPYLRYHVTNKATGTLGGADVCLYISGKELCLNENQTQDQVKTEMVTFFSKVVNLKEKTTTSTYCPETADYCIDDPQGIDIGYCLGGTNSGYTGYGCQITSTKIANELHLINKPVAFMTYLADNLILTISDTVSKRQCSIITNEDAIALLGVELDENDTSAYICLVNE